MEDELLGGNTGEGSVAQRVVQLAVLGKLSGTTPSVAKDQDTWEVSSASSSGRRTEVNINLSSCAELSPGLAGSCFKNKINLSNISSLHNLST